MATLIRNKSSLDHGIELMMQRVENIYVAEYRQFVWATFVRLLYETPQYSGLAVASWNIGVDSPNMSEPSGFTPANVTPPSLRSFGNALNPEEAFESAAEAAAARAMHRGHKRAIDFARRRNAPQIAKIQRRSKVFFTNTALGDKGHDKAGKNLPGRDGKSKIFYLEALQDQSYWQAKLRDVNQPYETVDETKALMQIRFSRHAGSGSNFGYGSWEKWV